MKIAATILILVLVAVVVGCSRAKTNPADKTTYTVTLTDAGDSKIAIIRAIRLVTGQGLLEAKTMVESTPVKVIDGLTKAKAEAAVKEITDAGGTATFE